MKNITVFSSLGMLLLSCAPNLSGQTINIMDDGNCLSTMVTHGGTFNGKNYYSNGGAGVSIYWDVGDNRWEIDGSNATPGTNTFIVWVSTVNTPLNPPDLGFGNWTEITGFCGNLTQFDGSGTTLPVELISFRANKNGKNIFLDWQTESEQDNDKFEVETSPDGEEFIKIGEVAGGGTTTEQRDYGFMVDNPYLGLNYFRLKQIDFEGQFKYSGIVSSNFDANDQVLGYFYPNPTPRSGMVKLDYTSESTEEIKISVFDVSGKFILSEAHTGLTGSNNLNLNFSKLNGGIYFVRVKVGGNTTYRKLVIEGQ